MAHGDNGAVVERAGHGNARPVLAPSVPSPTSPADGVAAFASLPRPQQIVLLKSSRFNGRTFRLWDDAQVEKNLHDDDNFSGEEVDLGIGGECEAYPLEGLLPVSTDGLASSLFQAKLNDCSVVATLIACAHWSCRFNKPLAYDNIHHDRERGRLLCRLFVNGRFRMVAVTDKLPRDWRRAMASSETTPTLVWPALLEKAYFSLVDVARFGGSNCASDGLLLTGWLPELILSHDAATLGQLQHAFNRGDCIVSVGSRAGEREDLVAEHAYAVIAMDDEGLVLRNPWRAGDMKRVARQDLAVSFGTICVNWLPSVWRFRHEQHVSTIGIFSAHNIADAPRVVLQNDGDAAADILIVVSHHRIDSQQSLPRTSVVVHDSLDRWVAEQAVYRSDELVGRDVTFRISLPAQSMRVVSFAIITNQPHSASIFLASDSPSLSVMSSERRFASATVDGCWTDTTAGGPTSCYAYRDNPSYTLALGQSGMVDIVLESRSRELLQIDLLWGDCIPASLSHSEMVVPATGYRQHISHARTRLDAGTYTVVPSTFRPGVKEDFRISVLRAPEGDIQTTDVDASRLLSAGAVAASPVSLTRQPHFAAGRARHRVFFTEMARTWHIELSVASSRGTRLDVYVHAFRKSLQGDPISGSGNLVKLNVRLEHNAAAAVDGGSSRVTVSKMSALLKPGGTSKDAARTASRDAAKAPISVDGTGSVQLDGLELYPVLANGYSGSTTTGRTSAQPVQLPAQHDRPESVPQSRLLPSSLRIISPKITKTTTDSATVGADTPTVAAPKGGKGLKEKFSALGMARKLRKSSNNDSSARVLDLTFAVTGQGNADSVSLGKRETSQMAPNGNASSWSLSSAAALAVQNGGTPWPAGCAARLTVSRSAGDFWCLLDVVSDAPVTLS